MTQIANSVFGAIGAATFAVWFLLTIVFQKKNAFSATIGRFDRLNLIPRWSFFAPDPGASNYHFIYRGREDETSASAWHELNLSPRGIFSIIWNPRKRYRESLIELFHLLEISSREHSAEQLQFTTPYVVLLNVARKRLEGSLSPRAFYQFALVETRGASAMSQPRVRFYSLTHPVS